MRRSAADRRSPPPACRRALHLRPCTTIGGSPTIRASRRSGPVTSSGPRSFGGRATAGGGLRLLLGPAARRSIVGGGRAPRCHRPSSTVHRKPHRRIGVSHRPVGSARCRRLPPQPAPTSDGQDLAAGTTVGLTGYPAGMSDAATAVAALGPCDGLVSGEVVQVVGAGGDPLARKVVAAASDQGVGRRPRNIRACST